MTDDSVSVSHLQFGRVAGVPCAVTDPPQAVGWLLARIRDRAAVTVRLINAYSVVAAHDDDDYLRSMRTEGVSLPDGAYVVGALRLLDGQQRARRVRGPSYFRQVLAAGVPEGVRHFFLGTEDATLHALERQAMQEWPGLRIAGCLAPEFQPVTDARIAEYAAAVRAAGADVVWVALGTPKQDLVAARLAPLVGVPCVAVGAAFDFLAGTKAEAPVWAQRVGLEWLWRFASEPVRLWRRYLIGNVRFVWLVLRHRGAPRPAHI